VNNFLSERDEMDLGRLVSAVNEKLTRLKETQRVMLKDGQPSKHLSIIDGDVGAYQILYDTLRTYREVSK